MLQTIKAKLIGKAPLLMHNGQLADPLNPFAIALAASVKSSSKKTGAGIAETRKYEWFGSLYLDEAGHVCIPADMVLAMAIMGAKKSKQGMNAKSGVYTNKSSFKLEYKGPKDPNKLYEDPRFVDCRGAKVPSGGRVMRTRPVFREWAVEIEMVIDTEVIDTNEVCIALDKAGQLIGLGDFRPRFGRFEVEHLS